MTARKVRYWNTLKNPNSGEIDWSHWARLSSMGLFLVLLVVLSLILRWAVMAWTTRSIFMKREPLTSTLPVRGSSASTAAASSSMPPKTCAPPKPAAACCDCSPRVNSFSMPSARAWRPASSWNCGPWSPTSPMSPITIRRGPGSSARTSSAARMESGLAL